MQDTKTFNQWLAYYGYHWVSGEEELLKGEMPESQAQRLIEQYRDEGKIY